MLDKINSHITGIQTQAQTANGVATKSIRATAKQGRRRFVARRQYQPLLEIPLQFLPCVG